MNSTTEELIRNSSVKALKIREKREAAEERKKRQEQRDQEQTKLLIRKAKENGNVFIKYLLFQILDEYEKTPEAIANFDNNCFIWKTISFLGQFSSSYSNKNKTLCEIHNASLTDDKIDEFIYYFEMEKGDRKYYLPVIIDLQKLEDLGIFSDLKLRERELKIKVDMAKLRVLTAKARFDKLTGVSFDKETIKRLQETYDNVRAQEEELNRFLLSIKSNSDLAYLDIMKRLISAYKSKPNEEETTVSIPVISSNPTSPYERMVRLFKDSEIDPEDAVVYYPIKTNTNPKVKPTLYPILVSDVMKKIQEDLPETKYSLTVYKSNPYDTMDIKVNTLDFESLLISIQNPEEPTRRHHN